MKKEKGKYEFVHEPDIMSLNKGFEDKRISLHNWKNGETGRENYVEVSVLVDGARLFELKEKIAHLPYSTLRRYFANSENKEEVIESIEKKRMYHIKAHVIDSPRDIPHKEKYSTFEEFIKEWNNSEKDADTGKYGYWENPNAKWDWFQLGGRWTGVFKLKPGSGGEVGSPSLVMPVSVNPGWVDQAYKKDIDFDFMKEKSFEEASETYDEFEKKFKKDPRTETFHPYFDFGVKNKGDKDNFVPETRNQFLKNKASIATFAVVKDGKWYEKGEMGWWACVSDEKEPEAWVKEFEGFLESLPDNTLLSVYDCHI